MRDDEQLTVKIELLSQWKLEAEFPKNGLLNCAAPKAGTKLNQDYCKTLVCIEVYTSLSLNLCTDAR